MSDGDLNATPDAAPDHPRHASGVDSDGVGLTGIAPRSRAAAPWERFGTPAQGVVVAPRWSAPAAETAADQYPETTGCHTDGGLTVADLIAKMGGSTTDRPRRHHAAPDTEPPDPTPYPRAAEEDDEYDAYAVPTPSAYAAELAGLELSPPSRHTAGSADSDQTTLLPKTEQTTVLPKRSMRPRSSRIVGAAAAAESTVPKPKRKCRAILLAGRSVAALIAAMALALTGAAWQWSSSKNHMLNTISALDPQSRDILDPGGQYGDEDFLIVGIDSRAGANSDMGAGDTEDAGGARSDTVMLVNIPANRKRVVAVSFPRDLAITPVKCEAWNPDTGAYGPLYDEETGKYGPRYVYTETKLNSAYAFGGPKCLVKVIQKLSGLSINRFIAIDFAGFAKMVDALGGVEVCSTTKLRDAELGTVLAHAGRQIIDGQTALNYVRARNVTTENNGDYGRIKRQQLFLSSLLRSLISRDTFFSLSKLNNVVNMFIGDSYVDNVKTKDLVDLGQSVQGLSAGHVTFVTVPTGETDENGDEPPRNSDMRALFDAIINDDPLPGENDLNATSSPTTQSTTSKAPQASPSAQAHAEQVRALTTAPQDIMVQVSNSTGKSGLAATVSDELVQHGFKVMAPDDYPSKLKSTTVFFSPGNERAAATVAAAFGSSKVERVTGIGKVVQVVLGPDFSRVGNPPPTGSSVSVEINRNTNSTPTKLPEDLAVTNGADTRCE
jgi:LCP family protein required for cell wall assembly